MTSGQDIPTVPLNQFEESPHNMQMYLQAIFNNTGYPIFVKNEQFKFILVNDACCSFFGLSRKQILGSTLAESFPPNEMEGFFSIDRQVLEKGEEILCEETLSPTGVQSKRVLTRKNRFIEPNGNYFLVGVIHDITESKQIEEKLKLCMYHAKTIEFARKGFFCRQTLILIHTNGTEPLVGSERSAVIRLLEF